MKTETCWAISTMNDKYTKYDHELDHLEEVENVYHADLYSTYENADEAYNLLSEEGWDVHKEVVEVLMVVQS